MPFRLFLTGAPQSGKSSLCKALCGVVAPVTSTRLREQEVLVFLRQSYHYAMDAVVYLTPAAVTEADILALDGLLKQFNSKILVFAGNGDLEALTGQHAQVLEAVATGRIELRCGSALDGLGLEGLRLWVQQQQQQVPV